MEFIRHPKKSYRNKKADPIMASFFSGNTSLSSLSICNCKLDDERGSVLLGSLANNSLKRVEFSRLLVKGNKLGEKSSKSILTLL